MSATLCYCSSREGADCRPLAVCADCNWWLRENSPRIVRQWQTWPMFPAEELRFADAIEENRLAVFLARRFLANG